MQVLAEEVAPGSDPIAADGALRETRAFAISGVVDPRTGKRLSPSVAQKAGIVDLASHVYHGLDANGQPIDVPFDEAIRRGLLVAEKAPTVLRIAAVRDPKTGQLVPPPNEEECAQMLASGIFRDPATGREMPLEVAVQQNLVILDDGTNCQEEKEVIY